MDILKLDQVNVGSSTLDTRPLPEEKPDDKKCCEEAAKAYYFTDLKESMNYGRILYNDNPDRFAGSGYTIEALLDYEANGPSQVNFDESEVASRSICEQPLQIEVLKTILEGRANQGNYRGYLGKKVWQKIIDDWKACEKW